MRNISGVIVVLIVLAGGVYLYKNNPQLGGGIACTMEAKICPDGSAVGRSGPKCEFAECPQGITYRNAEYGFSVSLPASWQGYTIIRDTLEIHDVATNSVVGVAPTIAIRNRLFRVDKPYQDIPIYIFTLSQWSGISGGKYSVSAAPILPSELARNSKYVFALPARYNYGFPEGFQEVEQILAGKPVTAFEPAGVPGAVSPITLRAKLGQRVSGLDVSLTPLEVTEDSRCPVDVQCIWAGTVKVRTKIESGLGDSTMIFEIGKPITTEAEEITLTGVLPAPKAGVETKKSDYAFQFEVKKR